MEQDIGPIIEGWEFDPDEICVRKITGSDGTPKIQVRLDLGLLQMEMKGRPDGKRPLGQESLLDHYERELETYSSGYGSDAGFKLDREACALLGQEGLQYYQRYVCLFHLEEFDGVERDTARNLRMFDLIHRYASDEEDRGQMEQYRPYVLMMNTRARGAISIARKDWDSALQQIQEGIDKIKAFLQEKGQADGIGSCDEIAFLTQWEEEVRGSRPMTLKQRLQRQMREAIEKEDFERAARIRDQVRRLEEDH